MTAIYKKISEVPLVDGKRYATYDVYYPVEGLIACKQHPRYSVLNFEKEAKLEQFYQKIPKKVHDFFAFVRCSRGGRSRSERDQRENCVLKMVPFPGYIHSTIDNRIDYLMQSVYDRSTKSEGFSHRVAKYESGATVMEPKPESKHQNKPLSQPKTPKNIPPAPSSRTTKSFAFP